MAERATIISEDQRAVTRAELDLIKERFGNRLEKLETEMSMKASLESVDRLVELIDVKMDNLAEKQTLKMDHISKRQDEISAALKWTVGVIIFAVISTVLAGVLIPS